MASKSQVWKLHEHIARNHRKDGLASKIRKTYGRGEAYSIFDKDFLGVVLWEGVSPITGQEIVVLATWFSDNSKTGDMIQISILVRDVSPVIANKTGCDRAVCGDCPHRINGTCYVAIFHGPRAAWDAYQRGRYAYFDGDYSIFDGRKVRFGMYGDPALIPLDIVQGIVNNCAGHTGYTHQWANIAPEYMSFFQASCDSVADLDIAERNGWGAFVVLPVGMDKSELPYKTTRCPVSINPKIQCVDCGMCDGKMGFSHRIVIEAHGKKADSVEW